MIQKLLIRIIAILLGTSILSVPASAKTWHKAETHHFEIYSDGKAKQLTEFAHELERLDALLRLKWNRDPVENPNKLTVYLLKNADAVDDLLDQKGATIAGFYRARSEGSIMVGNRRSDRSRGALSGKQVVFHEYGHHFFFQNFKIPAAAWYVEGFADYVSTARFADDGSWELGRANGSSQLLMAYGGEWDIEELLTSTPFEQGGQRWRYFYGWSWGLTHYLYSREQGRGAKITRYLTLINGGIEPLAAAEQAFGDLDELKAALRAYVVKPMTFQKSAKPLAYRDSVTVRQLSEYDSRTVRLTLERLSAPSDAGLVADLKQHAEAPGSTAEAWYQHALQQFDLAHDSKAENAYDFSATTAALKQALARDPAHAHALVLKGRVLLEAHDHGDDPAAVQWEEARALFRAAREAAPGDPWPIYNIATSYRRRGETSDEVGPLLAQAFKMAPESNEYRLAHALELADQGKFEAAINAVKIIANNPHGRGEGAQSIIKRIEQMREEGGTADRPIGDTAGPSA